MLLTAEILAPTAQESPAATATIAAAAAAAAARTAQRSGNLALPMRETDPAPSTGRLQLADTCPRRDNLLRTNES